jgi:hypothetical protein
MPKAKFLFLLLFSSVSPCFAVINLGEKVNVTGSLQSDILFPQEDESIGTGTYNDFVLTNTYLDLHLHSEYLSVGTRFEYLKFPLPGYERDFAGWGIPYLYATGKYKNFEATIGDIYDQFGSGLIFRTYEERSLGIDNSLRGGRLKIKSYKGIDFKLLAGKQRRYWDRNDSFIWGTDAEFNIEQWSKQMQENNLYLMLGASYVGKHEKSDDIYFYVEELEHFERLNLPVNIGATEFRIRLQKDNVSILGEYAVKANDPSTDNSYIYHEGNVALLSASYSKRGMSALLQAKRSDNMAFRSRRNMQGISSYINHLPAFTQQHTYALATIYPYATQPEGEWAFQGEFSYTFKKQTLLGGKYGTIVKLNASHVRSIDRKEILNSGYMGKNEYVSPFFKAGKEIFYQDINVDIDKKLSNFFKMNLMYMNQRFNPKIVGHNEERIISNIFIWEGKYQVNKKTTLRTEIQYLSASRYNGDEENLLERSNQGDWVFGLMEISLAPHFMFSISDMYNAGVTKEHYYMASGVYNYKSHRIQLAYGRTRAGYDCSGGVCRLVPASKGFRINYIFNF